jgi:hypothetical protein
MEINWPTKWFRTNSMLRPKIKVYGGTGRLERRAARENFSKLLRLGMVRSGASSALTVTP